MDHQFSRAEAWHFSDVWPILLPSALLYDNQRMGSMDVLYINAARCTSMDRSESREKVIHSD
jgi:hypothetical protein